jgi:hypothetical protein
MLNQGDLGKPATGKETGNEDTAGARPADSIISNGGAQRCMI